MAVINERIDTRLPLEPAFAFVADFANAERWDPGTETSRRVDQGPVGVGSTYELGVKMAGRVMPMTYRITTFEPGRRVVLEGSGSGVRAVDDIRFAPGEPGTRIDYRADIRLVGLLRLLAPFAGGAIARIGREARAGMEQALDRMAAAA
jgi:hypothetical protein